jgi:3',5'-cyclic AMP phosphodiesterase CpdA
MTDMILRCWLACIAAWLLVGCSSTDESRARGGAASAAGAERPITLLAFGDSGYHYDYLEAEDYKTVVTEQQFLDKERADWIDDKRPIDELAYPPMYRLPANGSIVSASGLAPASKAMHDYCSREAACDFSVMLGDNIYPDGASGGADDRDPQRFQDLFVKPFAGLARGKDDFRIYAVLGNHDWRTSRAGAEAEMAFLKATPPFFMDGPFYRVQPPAARGELEIFAIDTEVLLAGHTVYKAVLADDASEAPSQKIEPPKPWSVPASDGERQIAQWLEASLATSTARWKVVIGHHPLWSTAGSKFEQAKVLRRLILPALCKYADVYVAGHEHTLEVHTDDCSTALPGQRVDPLVQVVSGSAAKMRPTNTAFIRHQQQANPELQTLFAHGLVWGFAHLTFERDRVQVRIIETPNDGSATTHLVYERSFSRRHARGWD